MITALRLDYWFGQVDSRPLSLFRIGFGALLLKHTLYLIPLAHLFYSDEGIVPRARFWDNPAQAGLGQFSLLNGVAASWGAILIFSIWAAIALALLVGYRTRLMAVLNYLLWLSLLHRNPFSLHAPDHVMLLLSFWILFLPLNHHFAVDRWLARHRQRQSASIRPVRPSISSPVAYTYAFPLRVIQIQVALIYLFTSYYKWQGLFWRTGDALFYTFQQEGFLLSTGLWLGGTAPLWLLRLLTWSTLLIEASFALLVFIPVWQPWARAVGLGLAALLHLGIAITMAIPDFSLVMGISYLLFFAPAWVVWLERQGQRLLHWPTTLPDTELAPDEQQENPAWPLLLGRAAVTLLLALILAATVWGGVAPVNNIWNKAAWRQPAVIRVLNEQLHLASPWTMFAYYARPRSGWLLINGAFENGARQLLYTSIEPTSGHIYRQWGPAARLRFFEQRLLWSFPETILRAWGSYYCRRDSTALVRRTGQRLLTVEIHRRYRWAHDPGAPPNPVEDDLLWRHHCF